MAYAWSTTLDEVFDTQEITLQKLLQSGVGGGGATTNVFSGDGDPSPSQEGLVWINNLNGDVWYKQSGTWRVGHNLT